MCIYMYIYIYISLSLYIYIHIVIIIIIIQEHNLPCEGARGGAPREGGRRVGRPGLLINKHSIVCIYIYIYIN